MKRFCPILFFSCALVAAPTVEETFRRLYDHDFTGSLATADAYVALNSADPMAHAARASACLFSELHRLNLLGKEFMTSDDKIKSAERALPKERARLEFLRSVGEARRLAARVLSSHATDVNALLAMTIVTGLERDYDALIEKRLRASLERAKESQQYALRLNAADPTQYDAYFTFGFSEYLIGSLPFFAKWFMKLEAIEGNKAKGLAHLETAATKGRYLSPFARMMLAMFYMREKRPDDSRRHLRELAREFPGNTAVRAELARLERPAAR